MKKATILAVSLFLTAAISAVWIAREQSGSEQTTDSLAGSQVPMPPRRSDSVTEPGLPNNRSPIEVVPNLGPAPSAAVAGAIESGAPTPFLTDAEFMGLEYAEARFRAQVLFNRFTDQYVDRMRFVALDHDAYEHVLEAAGSGTKEVDQPFAIDIFQDKPCTISSFNHVLGQSPQNFWAANARCDNDDSQVWIYDDKGELVFRVLSRNKDLRVARLPGISAYVAFEVVTFRRNPITTF